MKTNLKVKPYYASALTRAREHALEGPSYIKKAAYDSDHSRDFSSGDADRELGRNALDTTKLCEKNSIPTQSQDLYISRLKLFLMAWITLEWRGISVN